MNDTATNPAAQEASAPTAGDEAASIVERYVNGSDSERDQIAADHSAAITEEVQRRAKSPPKAVGTVYEITVYRSDGGSGSKATVRFDEGDREGLSHHRGRAYHDPRQVTGGE